jgi:hypothetical protein
MKRRSTLAILALLFSVACAGADDQDSANTQQRQQRGESACTPMLDIATGEELNELYPGDDGIYCIENFGSDTCEACSDECIGNFCISSEGQDWTR